MPGIAGRHQIDENRPFALPQTGGRPQATGSATGKVDDIAGFVGLPHGSNEFHASLEPF
jgi:hypothetical protein